MATRFSITSKHPMNELNLGQGGIEVAPASVRTESTERRFSDDLAEQDLSYWRQRLSGIPAILELPTDRPRPPAQSFRAARESVLFPRSLKQALDVLCEREGVSRYVVLLAAFQTLLTRYTRQDDIVVGSTIPGSEEVNSQKLLQRPAATVAIRTDMSDGPTFRQLLPRVSDAINAAREHRNAPWERLVETVQPDRDASHHPIFQALFALEDSEFLPDSDWEMDDPAAEAGPLNVDLQLRLCNRLDGLAAHLIYSTDLFDAATMVRMAGHFRKLIESIIANPEQHVSRLSLLTDEERQQLLIEWNDTRMDYARDRCVHQLFETQAARTPNDTAVTCGNQSLTYGELDRRANKLANHLIKLGATADGLVGICVERSLEMVVGLLGILKAGSAYVPLDPAYPRDRIAFMLENSEVPLLLTQAQLAENLPKGNSRVILIDSDWHEIAKQSQQRPALTLEPREPRLCDLHFRFYRQTQGC